MPDPKLNRIEFSNLKGELYENIAFEVKAEVFDEANLIRKDQKIVFSSTNDKVISINSIGILSTNKPGKASVVATVGDITKQYDIKVIKNPINKLSGILKNKSIRSGDVWQI